MHDESAQFFGRGVRQQAQADEVREVQSFPREFHIFSMTQIDNFFHAFLE